MRAKIAALVASAILIFSSAATAQVAWDSPQLIPSSPPAYPELGIYLIDGAGAGVGAMVKWRSSAAPYVGFRLGLADGGHRGGDGISALGGVEVMGRLTRATQEFPLDMTWFFGAGAGVGDRARVSFPLGISVGHDFEGDGVLFRPYASPRVVLDGVFGSNGGLDLGLAVDVGIDIGFQPSWLIRFGGTFGDREAIAVGVVL